jgi:signal transduction histidine kinase
MAATLLLKSDDLPKSLCRPAERILTNVDRMARMIGDLLDFTRGRLGGGIPIEPKPVDLREIAEGVLENQELAHPGRMHREMRGALDGEWDGDRVAQALGNLVANAFEHGDPATPVRVELLDQGDRVAIVVHNEGKPIAEDEREHIFDPFRQGSTKRGDGLGLGLFIAGEIARAHDGTIALTSSSARGGTTFQVTLPRHPGPRG